MGSGLHSYLTRLLTALPDLLNLGLRLSRSVFGFLAHEASRKILTRHTLFSGVTLSDGTI